MYVKNNGIMVYNGIFKKKKDVKHVIHLLQEQYTKYGYDITRE